MRRHVVVAPDKFKGSLTATEAASRLMAGLHRVRPDVPVVMLPVADGGEGTVDAAVTAEFQRRRALVSGPTGQQVMASYALRSRTAIIEMAEASGLSRLPGGTRRPLAASSRGTGELIDAAIKDGAEHVVLGLGGSSCTDGGTGMAAAFGMRFLDDKRLAERVATDWLIPHWHGPLTFDPG
jgi:glycerate kinase